MINKSTNKLSLLDGNETIDNYKKNFEKNSLSQSTVIINNNYNFIKIKNNDIQNKKNRKLIISDKKYQSNSIRNINSNYNINNNDKNFSDSDNHHEIIKKKIFVDSKKEKFNEIKQILENLCTGDKEDMTELILKIHNILYTNYKKNESILKLHYDYIFNQLIQAINNLLDEKKIYMNYIKYISNVLCKISKLSDLISKISINTQNNLINLAIKIVSLLNDNQNDNNYYYNNSNEEHIIIKKCFNSIMQRIIEFGDINNSINILMNFEKSYRKSNKNVINYVAQCLFYISDNIKKNYEKIDIRIVLENIYQLLEDFPIDNINLKFNNKTDKIIMITIKKIISQLIIFRRDKELIAYIKNKNSKINNKISIIDYRNKENIKNWLIQYINFKKNEIIENRKKNKDN